MKKNILVLILLFFVFVTKKTSAQLERVFVEKYYVSDANDESNTSGGTLKSGSTTYRVYLDLAKKTKVIRLFGNDKFPIQFSSTELIYNNQTDGQSFGKDFVRSRYSDNLVALDSWLTIGQTSKFQGGKSTFGIPKEFDKDGSFIGGVNNDGGSQGVVAGLMINKNGEIGKALTDADGMFTKNVNVTGWTSNGLVIAGIDSTIFGLGGFKKDFKSNLFELKCDGVEGVDTVLNHVLIAQITTQGELSFNLNIELEIEEDGKLRRVLYVSKNQNTDNSTIYSPFLSYPFSCGCTDPNYLEFDKAFVCLKEGSCKTPVVIGCMDQNACNFDAKANTSLPALCCYPGKCNNRDITVVCPSLLEDNVNCSVYPNPVENGFVTVDVQTGVEQDVNYEVIDMYGKKLITKIVGKSKFVNERVSLEELNAGIYQIKVQVGLSVFSKLIIKQ